MRPLPALSTILLALAGLVGGAEPAADRTENNAVVPVPKLENDIGTNNFSGTRNARESTPAEVAEGIQAICDRIRSKSPETRIVLMGVFPRGASPKDGFRPKIAALNGLLAAFAKEKGMTYLDLGAKMLEPDGTLPREIMRDSVHPTEKGYALWASALKAVLKD